MWYVYIIRSINFPEQEYIGATADLKPAAAGPQRRQIYAHCKVQALGIGLVLRLPRQAQSARFREISQIPFRPSICEETPRVIKRPDHKNIHWKRRAEAPHD